jgi:hypothetical protein
MTPFHSIRSPFDSAQDDEIRYFGQHAFATASGHKPMVRGVPTQSSRHLTIAMLLQDETMIMIST